MRGYCEGPNIGSIVFILIFIGLYTWVQISFGVITISVTGQPQITNLQIQLNNCQAELEEKCDPCPECECKNPSIVSDFFLIVFGGIIGFIYFLFFGEDLKKWLLRRWTPEDQKNKVKKK